MSLAAQKNGFDINISNVLHFIFHPIPFHVHRVKLELRASWMLLFISASPTTVDPTLTLIVFDYFYMLLPSRPTSKGASLVSLFFTTTPKIVDSTLISVVFFIVLTCQSHAPFLTSSHHHPMPRGINLDLHSIGSMIIHLRESDKYALETKIDV